MEITTVVGIIVGIIAVVGAMYFKGISYSVFRNPAAIFVIFVGNCCAINKHLYEKISIYCFIITYWINASGGGAFTQTRNKGGLAYDHLWTRLATEACDDRVRTEDATTGIMPDTGSFERG